MSPGPELPPWTRMPPAWFRLQALISPCGDRTVPAVGDHTTPSVTKQSPSQFYGLPRRFDLVC
jgi:hypothetical protein